MQQFNNTEHKRGFTLIEVLVAATIIAVLTSIGVVSYQAANKQARDAKRKADLEQIRAALEMYKADNNWYPNTGSGNWTNTTNLGTPLTNYLSPIPPPPKTGEVYYYKATNASGGHYYGYCLSSDMEASDPTDSCLPYSGHEYGLKSP